MKKWKIINGRIPILLVASHNYPQIRNNIIKQRDVNTGKIVEKLCCITASWGIITKAIQVDPNWYVNSDFRKQLKILIKQNNIKAVFDIHGKKIFSTTLIDFYPNRLFKQKLSMCLKDLFVMDFKKNDQLTISEDLNLLNIPSVEVEIRRDGREPGLIYEETIELLKNIILLALKDLVKKGDMAGSAW